MNNLTSDDLAWARTKITQLSRFFDQIVVGQERLRTALLVTLLARGHILLESVPGLAKTLAASTLAQSVNGKYARIQCTPDLLPSDILGTQLYDQRAARFVTELGPVHANFVLLDEINRSSAKTQSAMLEAMQERQTSIAGQTYPLPSPFMVMATQNPIEEEGTYVLPQAQMDRFLLKEIVDYPRAEDEVHILERVESGVFEARRSAVSSTSDILQLQEMATRVTTDPRIKQYIVEIINVTRHPERFLSTDDARWLDYGSSPRGSIAFLNVARAMALLNGRGHVIPDDVVALRHAVLRHRLVLTFEALAEQVKADRIIDAIFQAVPTP